MGSRMLTEMQPHVTKESSAAQESRSAQESAVAIPTLGLTNQYVAGHGVNEDPGLIMTSCANCGAQMIDQKCKLICNCGYFLSCSDYY